jgi:hypothetical protein
MAWMPRHKAQKSLTRARTRPFATTLTVNGRSGHVYQDAESMEGTTQEVYSVRYGLITIDQRLTTSTMYNSFKDMQTSKRPSDP